MTARDDGMISASVEPWRIDRDYWKARAEAGEALLREFRENFTAFITAFEANDPHSCDGEDLAGRIDAFLATAPDYRVRKP